MLKNEVLLLLVIEGIQDLLNPERLYDSTGFVELLHNLALREQITEEPWIFVNLCRLQNDIHGRLFASAIIYVDPLGQVYLVLPALIIKGQYCYFIIFHCGVCKFGQ